MPPISVVIITFNEEKNIARCIQSVADIADEVVVLDSFSNDNTESICKSLDVQFYQHAFDGHIEQKNRAITYAKYPHILSLDADEAVDDELKAALLQVKENWQHDAYYVNRKTNYCGQWILHGHWYPDRKLRLWDSNKGKWGGLNPHDKFEMEEGSSLGSLDGHLLHYSFYTKDEFKIQMRKFAKISAQAAYDQGKKAGFWNLFLNPLAKFISGYFVKAGFMDGKAGFEIAIYNAYATYLKYNTILQHYKMPKA